MATLWPLVGEVDRCEDVERLMRWNRFLPSPQTPDQFRVIDAVVHRLSELRKRDEAGYVRASKAVGW